MDSFRLQAWGDESIRTVGVAQPSYLLGAVVANADDCQEYRREMVRLLVRGRKLHWRESSDRERTRAIETIAGIDSYHVVVVASPMERKREERARALCLERLAWQLDRDDVQLLTLEARPPLLMRRDRRTIDSLRGKGSLPAGLHIEHGLPSTEPMLWIADQVLGAIGESMSGGKQNWFDAVRTATTVIGLEL